MSIRHFLSCGTALSATLVTIAAAQAAGSGTSLDTVIVTGERIGTSLEESVSSGALGSRKILDTPFSITVIDDAEIQRRQVNSVAQLFVNDSSIFSSAPSATTNWWATQIRGIGVRNFYVDDVPFMMSWGGEMPLEPMERVDALKGLTGFMYGFGAPGGAISYRTRQPTAETTASTSLQYRSSSVFNGQVDAGGRVGSDDQFGYRANLVGEYGEAYNSADVNRGLASLALDYRITDGLQWFATAMYQYSKLENEPLHFYLDTFQGAALPSTTDDYEKLIVRGSFYETDTFVGSTGIKWQINDAWRSSLTGGYAEQDHRSNRAFADLLNEAGDYDGWIYNFAQRSGFYIAQALAEGTVVTGPVRHELVFGASYERELTQPSLAYTFENEFAGNIYQQQTYTVDDVHPALASFSRDDRQLAVFVSDTLHFGDHWQAMAGVRYTDYEVVDRDHNPAVDSSYQTEAYSPTYALIFKPTQQVSFYGSVVEAMEKGVRVGSTYANAGELLEPTISTQYEVGAKLELPRLSFTTAAFRVEQAARIDEIRDGLRYLTQDGLTVYDGIEATGSFSVTPNVRLGMGVTYLDAAIERVSPQNQAIEGHVPAGVQDWQAVASIDYRVPQVAGLSLFGNVRYYDDAYYDTGNRIVIPSRTLANVGLQYRTEVAGRRMVVTGTLNNLFNDLHWEMNSFGEDRNAALGVQVYW